MAEPEGVEVPDELSNENIFLDSSFRRYAPVVNSMNESDMTLDLKEVYKSILRRCDYHSSEVLNIH